MEMQGKGDQTRVHEVGSSMHGPVQAHVRPKINLFRMLNSNEASLDAQMERH